jgi:hypothetical protein
VDTDNFTLTFTTAQKLRIFEMVIGCISSLLRVRTNASRTRMHDRSRDPHLKEEETRLHLS